MFAEGWLKKENEFKSAAAVAIGRRHAFMLSGTSMSVFLERKTAPSSCTSAQSLQRKWKEFCCGLGFQGVSCVGVTLPALLVLDRSTPHKICWFYCSAGRIICWNRYEVGWGKKKTKISSERSLTLKTWKFKQMPTYTYSEMANYYQLWLWFF